MGMGGSCHPMYNPQSVEQQGRGSKCQRVCWSSCSRESLPGTLTRLYLSLEAMVLLIMESEWNTDWWSNCFLPWCNKVMCPNAMRSVGISTSVGREGRFKAITGSEASSADLLRSVSLLVYYKAINSSQLLNNKHKKNFLRWNSTLFRATSIQNIPCLVSFGCALSNSIRHGRFKVWVLC